MSIADQITRLQNAKASIKTSIENKGVSVGDDVKLDGYPALIDSISVSEGGGETVSSYWPNFFEFRTQNGTNADYLFAGISPKDENIKNLIENLDASNITSMKSIFNEFCYYGTNNLTNLDLTKWDVSKCEDFDHTFDYCKLENLDISGWDFSSTSNLRNFLGSCFVENLNMSNCNVSNITNFSYFASTYGSSALVIINITGCDTSNATNMNSMFSYYRNLTTITGSLDLSNLTNGFYPGSGSNPVYRCSKLETLYLKNIYKNCTMTNASKWSINLGDTKVKDECLIYIINELPDLINDKGLTATDKIILTLPPNNTLTAEQVQPAIDKGWTVANTTY